MKVWGEIKSWTKKNRKEAFILCLILVVGAILRLYKIDQYMTFLGDEGRDAIIVRRLLVNFDPILIGPGTSIGNMYLGPLYYYMMAPALLLSNFSPVGPAIMIALLGVVTIWLVWYFTRQLFPTSENLKVNWGALISAALFAIAPVVITYSRSSWNPNIMPFFSLLCIFSLWKIWRKNDYKWLFVLGISFAFVLQSHYLGLLLIPTIIIFWLLSFVKLFGILKQGSKNKFQLFNFLKYSVFGLLVLLFLMSPLAIFDARHGWQNFGAISKFFTERQETVSIKPWKALPTMFPIWKNDFITRIVGGKNSTAGLWIAFGLMDLVILYLVRYFRNLIRILKENKDEKPNDNFIASVFLITSWLIFAIIGLALYKQHIYDHYFGFIYAAPFILYGGLFIHLWGKYGPIVRSLLVISFFWLVYINILENPLKYPPNRQMQRAVDVAQKIKEKSGGEKLNIAVIAKQNYEDGYQYFLERWNLPVYDINPLKLDETVAPQLFAVCELPENECDPTHSPKAEIANFGWSKIDGQWEVGGVVVYRLIHSI